MTSTCAYRFSPGDSEAAKSIEHATRTIAEHCLQSVFLRRRWDRIRDQISELGAEAACPGWDGYGEKPVSRDALERARSLLLCLPFTFPLPDVGADGEGNVTLDWHFGWRRAFTAAVAADGRIFFAWVRGYSSSRGTEWFSDDEVPRAMWATLAALQAGLPAES